MKPVKDGRASICNWSLRASFLTKEQAVKAVRKILKEEIDFNVSFEAELDATRTHFVVNVDDMSWANNLSTVARILESVDYDDK